VNTVVASRLCISFIAAANMLAIAASSCPAAAPALLATLLVLASPIPASALAFTRTFRLNEGLAAAIAGASTLVCLPALLLLAVAAPGAGLVPGQAHSSPLWVPAEGAAAAGRAGWLAGWLASSGMHVGAAAGYSAWFRPPGCRVQAGHGRPWVRNHSCWREG
jgi:hypothetical protein